MTNPVIGLAAESTISSFDSNVTRNLSEYDGFSFV